MSDNTSKLPRIIYSDESVSQLTSQCDCVCEGACSHSNRLNVINLSSADPQMLYRSDFSHIHLNDEYAVCYHLPAHTSVVLNNPAFEFLALFEQPRSSDKIPDEWRSAVIQSPMQDLLQLGLLFTEDAVKPLLTPQYETLSAWLHLTGRCNLRCTYCYLSPQSLDLSFDTGKAAIDATCRSALKHSFRRVKFKYSGGEPLLRFPLVLRLHRYAQHIAKQHELELDGVILSNGTLLTPAMVADIQDAGLRLMISLDGLGHFHDRQRVDVHGNGTSATVLQAIEFALDAGLIPDISITVTAQSAAGLPEVAAWVLERNLPFSLNFYRDPLHRKMALEKTEGEAEAIVQGMLAAYKVIEGNLPPYSLLAALADRANLAMPHLRTCGVGQSYLVFDTQGNISKCQMDMEKIVTNVYADDPLIAVRSNQAGIRNLPVDEKDECRCCKWKYWCAGGCPLVTYQTVGRYDVKSPNCDLYKTLYPEIIRLEGLRLLKYRGASPCRQE